MCDISQSSLDKTRGVVKGVELFGYNFYWQCHFNLWARIRMTLGIGLAVGAQAFFQFYVSACTEIQKALLLVFFSVWQNQVIPACEATTVVKLRWFHLPHYKFVYFL